MKDMYHALFGVFGVIVGSFLNVVILRHEKREAVTGRSYCPACHKTLRWYELVPVVSYVLQRGKCRRCAARISMQYPLVELATGCVFVLLAGSLASFAPTALALFALEAILWALLVVIAVYDLRTMLIPNRFSYTFAVLALIYASLTAPITVSALIAGPVLFVPFYLLWEFSDGRWMGLGDGKLALGLGWYLGLSAGASAVMFAFWIGAIVSLALLAVSRYSARNGLTFSSEVPFGPYLVLGCAVVRFTGYAVHTLIALP